MQEGILLCLVDDWRLEQNLIYSDGALTFCGENEDLTNMLYHMFSGISNWLGDACHALANNDLVCYMQFKRWSSELAGIRNNCNVKKGG